MFDARRGAWSTFQYLCAKRLARGRASRSAPTDAGRRRRLARLRRSRRAAEADAPSCGARTAGSGSSSKDRSGLKRLAGDDACRRRRSTTRPFRRARASAASGPGSARRPRARPSSTRRSSRRRRRRARAAGRRRARGRAVRAPLVEPGGRHRAAQLPRARAASPPEWAASAKIASESTVISGSRAGDSRGRARISSSLKMIPLWMPTTAPWRIGWLLAAIVGWPLRVVAHVDEQPRSRRRGR